MKCSLTRSPSQVFALFLAAALFGRLAWAQNPTPAGNLYGQIFDEQGQVLPGVAVTLAGPAATRTASADARGQFHFLNLPPATYIVTLEQSGFAPVRREVAVALGRDAVLALTMPVAAAAEAVTVTGEAPAIDSRKVETGVTFSQKELETIPTTRDPWAFVRQVPGVLVANMNVGGSESATQSTFVGKGSHPDQNSYSLDGVVITDMAAGGTPLYFDFDSLENIEVATGGSDASLATPGVALNLVTKRGTNELKGSARALRGKAGWDYGLEAGGPLWKDRVWLWGAAARTDFLGHTLTLVTGETVHQKPKLDQLNAKLDAQITPSNSLTLFYLHADKSFQGLSYFLSSQEATWDQTTPTQADRVEDSYVLSQRLFASLYFSYLNEAITLTPEGGRDKQAAIDADGIYRNSILFARVRRPQHQAGATLSAFFDTGTIAHELKFGFGYRHTIANSFSSWPGDKIIADELDGIALLTRDENIKYEMNYYDAYVQDTIQAGNLTLNAGTRFDYQQGRNLPSSVAANPVFPDLLPAVHYAGNTGYPITWRLTQPRIGATYALGKEKKTLVRASYSEFADQLGSEVFEINAFPGYQYLYYYWNDVNNDHHVEKSEVDLASGLLGYYGLDPNNPAAATSVNRIARNLEPPRTTELIFGVEREISPDFSASLAYTHRSLRNPEFGVPIGTSRGDYQYLGNAAGAITDAEGFTLSFDEPYYGLTAYPPPAGVEIRNRPDYRETYDGIEIQLVKRFSRGWMLRGSFAYNDWRKRVGVGAIVDPNNKVGGTNASGAVVEPVFASSRASIFINSKWQFNLSGLAELPFHIVAGANFFGRQGFALPYYVKVATHDTAGSRPNIQIGAVDDYRLPDVFEIDLHLERPFRIGQKLTVRASLDCFNAANSHTVLLRDENVGTWNTAKSPAFSPSPGFNQATETLEGRVFRGGVRISF